MPRVDWKMTGADKVVQEIRAQGKAAKEGAAALKQHAAEANRLDRVAIQLAKRNETAQETYKRKLLDATKALKGVEGGTKRLTRETTRLRIELLRATDGDKKLAAQRKKSLVEAEAAQKKAAAAADELRRKALSIVRENEQPLERFKRKYRELNRVYKQGAISVETKRRAVANLRRELRAAGTEGKRSFGANALSSAVSLAGGYLSVASAVGAVTRALQENREERERAIEGSRQAVRGEASLSQLAVTQGGTLEERKAAQRRLLAESRGAFSIGAFDTRDAAADTTFALNSAGLSSKDRQFAFRVKRSGAVSNVAGAAKAFSALTKSLGSEEVGSFDDFLDKSLQASALAPAQADEIPLAAARAGPSAKALGISDEFLFSATALLAGKTGSANEGGTRLASFLKQVEKAAPDNAQLRGLSGVELVRTLAALPESQQGFGGILGDRAEAIEGFRTLRDNLALLEAEVGNSAKSQSENLAQQAIAVAESDPNTKAAILQKQKKNQLELSQLGTATNNLLFEAALDERKRVRRDRAAQGDLFDQVAVETDLIVESTQIGLETLFGLRDAEGFKRGVQQEILNEGDIRDPALVDALRENTQAVQESNRRAPPAGGRAE